MIETSPAIKALSAALFKFQGSVHSVVKDARNPHFKNTYASLAAVIDTARPGLQSFGLVFTQSPGKIKDGLMEVTTLIVHPESGEWMRATMDIPVSKNDAQGAGSALTYALRYSLMATLGLPPVDDDGEAARNAGVVPAAVANGRPSPGPVATANPHSKETAKLLITALKEARTKEDLGEWYHLESTQKAKSGLSSVDYQDVANAYRDHMRKLVGQTVVDAG